MKITDVKRFITFLPRGEIEAPGLSVGALQVTGTEEAANLP
jgi:hypothetical protein